MLAARNRAFEEPGACASSSRSFYPGPIHVDADGNAPHCRSPARDIAQPATKFDKMAPRLEARAKQQLAGLVVVDLADHSQPVMIASSRQYVVVSNARHPGQYSVRTTAEEPGSFCKTDSTGLSRGRIDEPNKCSQIRNSPAKVQPEALNRSARVETRSGRRPSPTQVKAAPRLLDIVTLADDVRKRRRLPDPKARVATSTASLLTV